MVNTIFILDEYYKTQKVLTVGGANTFFDDLYTMDLSTGVESYEFSTNIVDIDESNYIMFYYHEQYKLFQITEIEQEHSEGGIITYCYGESASLELLNNAVRVFSGEFNCISFFEHILNGTGWSIGRYSSSLADKVMTIDVNRTTQVWSCIQDHMAIFGYELNTRVIYENGYLKHKLIDIFIEGELGNKTYKRFEYGRNVEGIIKKKDLYEWCTALIIETDAENILDVSYNSDGYVKEKGSDVVLALKENEKYNLGRNYIYASYEDNSPSGQEVVENAVAELIRRATPRFDYECDTILTYKEFEDISIGDTVYVIDHTFNPMITLEARVGKLELSFTDRNNCKCILTNYKEIKSGLDITLTGSIKDIVDTYFPITSDGIADGAITNGKIETTYYKEITADIVSASKVVAEQLIAQEVIALEAQIGKLEAEDATIKNLVAEKATIDDLNATNATITNLDAELADIQTLVNGNLTSDNIQSLNLTAANTTIENALIKNAMIDSISADKVNTGTLNTNNVNIQSEDGSMLLQGNLQQFKDENGNVRIQIGKDASGDFTFVLYDESGTGQLINAQGIQSSDAIADGLIVNSHVDDNANIHGSKLDIDSVITTINEDGSKTLKGSKIKLDDTNQTLDVAFNSMTEKVNNNTNALNTQSTQIGVQQGQISTLITNTTIQNADGTTTQLKDAYNSTKSTVDSLVTKIGSLETNYGVTLKEASVQYYLSTSLTSLSDGSWSDTAPAWTSGKYMWQRMKYTYTDGTVTYGSAACVAGAKGDKGQSLVSSVPQYYLSTSNTSQDGGSWVDTMPALADNKYLWLRYKLTWANPTATTYTTPVLEQVAESIKVISSKQATLEQSLDGFKTTVSSTYATKDELTGEVNEIENNMSQIEQTANKINWLVKSGDSQSNMTLTDKSYELISNNITLTANHIDLHGYVTANGGFSIDTNGNMTANNGTFSGDITGSTFSSANDEFKVLEDGTVKSESLVIDNLITTNTLNVDTINNPEYPKVMHQATTVYINSSAASATSWFHGATYSSISEMLAYAPRNLNGYTLSITLNSDINENVSLSWFHSGQVNFNFNGYTVNGYFYAYGSSMVYRLYGGVGNGSKKGKVMPYTGSKKDDYYYAIEFMYCKFIINNIAVYSDITNKDAERTSSGVLAHDGSIGTVFNLSGEGNLRHLVSSQSSSVVYVRKTSGMTNNTTFNAYAGGIITINSDTTQAGRNNTVGNPYWAGGGGSILCNQTLGMDKVQFTDIVDSGTPNTNPNTNTTITVTETVKATSADTYRSTVYNNWKGDGTVRQGDYGYGDCQGCWFFGNNLYNTMNAGTVTKVVIRIRRQSGGVAALQTMTVKSHNHTSRPSGAPTYTNTIGTCSCAVGSAIDLIITDTATINKLKACKGIGLSIGSASSPYIVCSGSCSVIITYKK